MTLNPPASEQHDHCYAQLTTGQVCRRAAIVDIVLGPVNGSVVKCGAV